MHKYNSHSKGLETNGHYKVKTIFICENLSSSFPTNKLKVFVINLAVQKSSNNTNLAQKFHIDGGFGIASKISNSLFELGELIVED